MEVKQNRKNEYRFFFVIHWTFKLTLHFLSHLAVNEINDLQADRVTLGTDGLVVQVVEVTRQTLVEQVAVTQGQVTRWGDRPTSGVDSTGLWWWTIELELVIGDNGTDSAALVVQDTVL